jgi:tetratricopeptide (TPR) repeat protein
MQGLSSNALFTMQNELFSVIEKEDPFWLSLRGVTIDHSYFGQGTISNVVPRKNQWPVFEVSFANGAKKSFNEQLFGVPGITYLAVPPMHPIPPHLEPLFRTKEQRDRGEDFFTQKRIREEQEARKQEEQRRAEEQALLEAQREQERLAEIRRNEQLEPLRAHYGNTLLAEDSLTEEGISQLDKLRATRLSPELERFLVSQQMYQVLAIYFTQQYRIHGELGVLSKATKYWRQAGDPGIVLQLSDEVARNYRDTQWCMVWTSRGAALADLGNYDEAVRCGTTVLEIQENQPHPYNMLGRTYILLGENEKGLEHFSIAERLSSNTRVVASMLRGVIKVLEPDRRRELGATMREMAATDESLDWLNDIPF